MSPSLPHPLGIPFSSFHATDIRSPEDSEHEVECMSPGVGELDVYPSVWGHWAGGPPGNMDDVAWLDGRLAKIFSTAPKRG